MVSSRLSESLKLVWLTVAVRAKRLAMFWKEAVRYYGNSTFRKVDLALLFHSLLNNPYSVSRRFHEQRGDKVVYAYGETPLVSVETIAKRCGLTSKDIVYDLGCGRGRASFWLNSFVGCRVVGVELSPTFVDIAQRLVDKFAIKGVEFRNEDILAADFSDATVVYLYGSLYDEAFIQKLIRRLSHLPKGTKIITVSYPLTDYTKMPLFEVVDFFDVPFLHGAGTVYLQTLR